MKIHYGGSGNAFGSVSVSSFAFSHIFVNKVESRDALTSILTYFIHFASRHGRESKANVVTKSQA